MSAFAAAALVGAGGAAGAVVRHVAVVAGTRSGGDVPWATFVVNVVGSFVLGVVVGASSGPADESGVVLLVGVGFCGALTTYSGVALQVVELGTGASRRKRMAAAGYALASLGCTVAAAALGYLLAPA